MATRAWLSAAGTMLVTMAVMLSGSGTRAAHSRIQVAGTEYRDLDGDRDRFPDTGETGRVVLRIANWGASLSNLTLYLTTDDPDVACLTTPLLTLSSLPAGATVTIGSLDPGAPGFTFKASDSLETHNPADPARIDFCLRVVAQPIQGVSDPLCFRLAADLDLPAGGAARIDGPDGLPDTADDGLMLENFDLDRDGDGLLTVRDTFRLRDEGTDRIDSGSYLRAGDPSMGNGILGGVACGGYLTPADGNAACDLDPDRPMDWHLHCAPGAMSCPNLETGPCVGGCSYQTPADGRKAISPPNSLHMGAHFNALENVRGDTTHLRSLQAFVSAPLNLTLFPRPGDLVLSMFHIARLVDNTAVGPGGTAQCFDCGDVQIQRDLDPDPAGDSWGNWDRLVPFQNVYDHVAGAWSAFAPNYCRFTPADTGTGPPAPRGIHETMCHPTGAWSSCGSVRGTTPTVTQHCPGPGFVDPSGIGVWVETRFDLAAFTGQRVRVRWIGSTWMLDDRTSSYHEGGWDTLGDDGWWIDNLSIGGVTTRQEAALPDTRPAVPAACPAVQCAALPADLTAWWPLDGDATDLTGRFDGTLDGGAGFGPGRVGGALTLDDASGVMTTPLIIDETPGMTFAAWVRTSAPGGWIMSTLGLNGTQIGTSLRLFRGVLSFIGHNPETTVFVLSGGPITDGVYHHIAAVWTGDVSVGGVRLYVDGVLVATRTASASLSSSQAPLLIGQGFDGQIDEVMVFRQALTGEEIAALHAAGSSGICPGPCIDQDGDGYGRPGAPECPSGLLTDCNDTDSAFHPGAGEVCDGVDNNCDDIVDDLGQAMCGTGPCARTTERCVDGVEQTCVPGEPRLETCNHIDDDCDGPIDENFDVDGDGATSCGGDCNDANPAIHPAALESCDGIDNNCDGIVDDLGQATCGIGGCARTTDRCVGGVEQTCVPGEPQPEICNGIDDDCDGSLPAGDVDVDGDGWTVCAGDCNDGRATIYPGAREINDGLDNDCPGDPGYGLVDEIDTLLFESVDRVCWLAQPGATAYQVARGVLPTFAGNCWLFTVTTNCFTETPVPPAIYYYRVRALRPRVGSWGRDSSGTEETQVCGQTG